MKSTEVIFRPVKGYYDHGLHTFGPECILEGVRGNGFELEYVKYSNMSGVPLKDPGDDEDVLIWLVARKVQELGSFVVPMQGRWGGHYSWLESKKSWK
jgi:hypothetical protein